MKRRDFLKGAALLAAAPVVAKASAALLPSQLILYGDGKHDDTEALQAWFDGKPVVNPYGDKVGDVIQYKFFRVSKTIHVTECHRPIVFSYNNLIGDMKILPTLNLGLHA